MGYDSISCQRIVRCDVTNLLCIVALLFTFIFVVGCSCYVFNASLEYEEVLKDKEGYNEKNVYLSFDSFVRFYSVAKDKYKINNSYKGYYFSREVVSEKVVYDNYKYTTVYTYNYFMDSFSDHLKYHQFCKDIEEQREQEERRKKEEKNLEQSDFALGEYVKLVNGDIAENEEQLNKKIQDLKDEIERQKEILKEK